MKTIESIEIKLLLEGIYQFYGYDFREYSPASIKRRIEKNMHDEKLNTISALQNKVLHDKQAMKRLLSTISVDVTAMFRDPEFYLSLKSKIFPIINEDSLFRIWDAGCSSGEQAYSLAILLFENDLYDKVKIYSTDMNDELLERGKAGIYPLDKMKKYTANYQQAGGQNAFSKYYGARYENAIMKSHLKKHIVWAQHNLASDSSFNEFQLIICRNVLIYFNDTLQNRVHKLLYDSLANHGILALGAKESLKFTPYEESFEEIDSKWKIYRKVR